jgi:hypothetical protein
MRITTLIIEESDLCSHFNELRPDKVSFGREVAPFMLEKSERIEIH